MKTVSPTRFLQHGILLSFLLITASGFIFTVLRVGIPGVPRRLTYLSYSTMAPYQRYSRVNGTISAEGHLPDGTWQPIDLTYYLPVRLGQRAVRLLDLSFRRRTTVENRTAYLTKRYRRRAELLLRHERERGNDIDAVRLYWDLWPISPEGYDAQKHSPFLTREFIVQYP